MELSELLAYANEKYQITEQHKWADFPGFSVLCHPETGKWVALLMRVFDEETGEIRELCDMKCGRNGYPYDLIPYLSEPFRMHGSQWINISFNEKTEKDVVFLLLDKAISLGSVNGHIFVLSSLKQENNGRYQETPLPKPDRIYQPKTEKHPQRLHEMRKLYGYGRESVEYRASNFYRQAAFMEDYEDEYPWSGEFFSYFPTYQDLTTKQLRGYFSWRTHLRKGDYRPIAVSAAYIYIYELLNGIGVSSIEDALDKMKEFERSYIDAGMGDQRMKRNLRRWMQEYVIIKDLPKETAEKYADADMMRNDAAITVLQKSNERSDEEVFDALVHFGSSLSKSPVLKSDPAGGMHLFAEAWRRACDGSKEDRNLFEACFGELKTHRWYPFSNAVYDWKKEKENREYRLNDARSYRIENGLFYESAYEKLSFDKNRLLGFLHECDCRFRRYLKTGRYLKQKEELSFAHPIIDQVIEEAEREKREAMRPKINIELSGLNRIRQDAEEIRDSLLVEEETIEPEVREEETEIKETNDAEMTDPVQLRIIAALLKGGDGMDIITAEHLMPSIAADMINESVFDEIGDIVVTCENERLFLVEDYIEDLRMMVGGH